MTDVATEEPEEFGKIKTGDVRLSKTLSWLLRHGGAVKEGLNIGDDGYVRVSDLLNHRRLEGKYTIDDIKRIVETDDKQKFSLRCSGNEELEICANQGHSLQKSDGQLSKTLSGLLRHGGAVKEGLNVGADGYVKVSDLLNHRGLEGKYSINDIKRIVETDEKKRFSLRCIGNEELEICANQGHSVQKSDGQLSKTLSGLLRHGGAVKEGLNVGADGYIKVSDLLNHRRLEGKYSINDIKRIVETDEKKRFSLRCIGNEELEICANQGHSLQKSDGQLSKTLSGLLRHGGAVKEGLKHEKSGDVRLSKILSGLLIHGGAVKEGLHVGADGYVKVSDLLNHRRLEGKYSIDDIKRIVETNDKQRFSLRCNGNEELEICANQGHSLQKSGDNRLSKTLSGLLKHGGAVKEGLNVGVDGYVKVSDLLNHRRLDGKYSIDDIKRIVETNDKQRFSLRCNGNEELEICANQGHSLQESADVRLSKTLCWLLRYAAVKEGLNIGADRYVRVSDLLNHRKLVGKYSIDDIKRIVETSDRQRFSLRCSENEELEIRANPSQSIWKSQQSPDVQLSKKLSWLLRHGAVKEGLNIGADGYVRVSDLLNHRSFKDKYSIDDIKRIVETNDKQRYSLRCNGNEELEICANQGHSLQCVTKTALKPFIDTDTDVIHGTYYKQWAAIKSQGLGRMSRNHIHFATRLPNDTNVISGIRADAEVFIYIDLKKARSEGIKFFKSLNNVILSPGDENGFIKSKYFLKVVDKHNKRLL